MADMTNDPDYKEYQEYLEYLKHPAAAPQAAPKAASYDPSQHSAIGNAMHTLGAPIAAFSDAGAKAATWGYLPDAMDARAKVVGGESGSDFNSRLAQERQDHPIAAAAGTAVGASVPAMAITGPAAAATAGRIGMGALGRVGANTLVSGAEGFARKPEEGENRLSNAGNSAKLAALLSGGAELAQGAVSGAKRAWDTGKKAYQMATGSTALRQEAQDALTNSSQALRNLPERDQLAGLIKGKSGTLNPDEYMGLHPEVDDIMTRAKTAANAGNDASYFKQVTGGGSSPVQMPLEDINSARQILDREVPWKKVPFGSPISPEAMDSGKRMAAKSGELRSMVNGSSSEIADASNAVHQGINGAEMLESKAKAPLAAFTTKAPDQRALLNEVLGKAGDAGQSAMSLADVLRSAKSVSKHPYTQGPLQVGWQGAKGAARSLGNESGALNDPNLLQVLQNIGTANR